MKNTKLIAVMNALVLIGVLTVNTLANALPIAGMNTGELSDLYPNLFVPAGLTFSVWALLYLLQILFVVFYLIAAFKKEEPVYTRRVSWFFFLASVFNIGWIFAWHYRFLGLSMLLMLGLLASLIFLYLKLEIGKSEASGPVESLFIRLPISMYLGWITVATVANMTALLVENGWNGFGISEPAWTIVMIIAPVAIALLMAFLRKDIGFSAIIIWALLGIIIKRSSAQPVYEGIVITAAIGIGLVALGNAAALLLPKKA